MRARLLERLAERRHELVALTEKLIATPSENPPGDERAVVQAIVEELPRLGLRSWEIAAKDEHRPNLIVRLAGKRPGPRLLYNAHTDTKPVGDPTPWQANPLLPTVRQGRLYGRGAMDMKASVAALVHAASALLEEGLPETGELWLVLSADEESGSRYGAKFLAEEHGLRGDAVLVAEPSGIREPWEFLAVGARGISCFKLTVSGTQMHSSISDRVPSINASLKAAHVLLALAGEFRPSYLPDPRWAEGPTLNPGAMVRGGVYYGVVSGHVEAGCDLRTVPGMTQEGLRRDLETFLDEQRRRDPDLRVELEFEPDSSGWTPATEIAPDHPLVQAVLRAAEEVLGRRPPIGTMPAVTDAVWFQMAGIPAIPAFGPGLLPEAHGPNESVGLDEILQAAQIYALTADGYLRGG